MRVLLLNPPTEATDGRAMQPLGLAYLAAVCRQAGAEVAIEDANCPTQHGSESLYSRLVNWCPDVLGMTVYSRSASFMVTVLPDLRRALPTTQIVVGGPCATVADESLLATVPEIDVVVRGEGEVTFLELLRVIHRREAWHTVAGITFREKDAVYRTSHRRAPSEEELNRLPLPARELLPPPSAYLPPGAVVKRRATNISRSRGCTRGCGFCSVSAFCAATRSQWRCRDAGSVVQEMIHLVSRYQVEQVYFCDDDFLHSIEKAREFCIEMVQHGTPATFSLSASVESVLRAKELLPLLRQAGAQVIELGLESGSDSALERLGKRTKVAQNEAAVQLVRHAGIRCRPDLILFDPHTSPAEIVETLSFLRRVGLFGHPDFLTLGNCLELYPGTSLRTRIRGEQSLDDNPLVLPAWRFINRDTARIHAVFADFLRAQRDRILALARTLNRSEGSSAERPGEKNSKETGDGLKHAEQMLLLNRLFSVPYELLEQLARENSQTTKKHVSAAMRELNEIAAHAAA